MLPRVLSALRWLGSVAVLAKLSIAVRPDAFHFQGTGRISADDIESALNSEMDHSDDVRIAGFETELRAMFTALPKDATGHIGHQAVRYGLHRFFAARHGWFIRGLEPGNAIWKPTVLPNGKLPESTTKEWVPNYLQDLLEARLASRHLERGLELNEMAMMAAALEDLVKKEVEERLRGLYSIHDANTLLVPRKKAEEVLKAYLMFFLIANQIPAMTKKQVMSAKEKFEKKYKGYAEVHKWFEKVEEARIGTNTEGSLSFDTVARIVHDIGEKYHEFNENECQDLRVALTKAESRRAGRVRLSVFYNMSRWTQWRFAEKPEYLKSLGVLDDSDPKQPSIIIANYAMSRSNCLEVSNLYAICCLNACEGILGHLEKTIGSAKAAPARLIELVSQLPSASVPAPRDVPVQLVNRLNEIATLHGGEVPLHGRLFAQWLHHSYPRDCPYPHEGGSINPQSPNEWLRDSGHTSELLTSEEMLRHMESDPCAVDWENKPECKDEESTEIPWNPKEELLNEEL